MSDTNDLTAEFRGDVLVVSFRHEHVAIDEMIVTGVSAELLTYTETANKIVLDMSNVDFFGSSFIEGMFRTWKRTKAKGGGFAVCCLTPHCHEVLEVTNLIEMWGAFESCDAAVGSLSA